MGLRERYETIVEGLLAGLREKYADRLVAVALFGSVARGTQREDSDIDFLIIARDLPRGRTARVDEFLPVEQPLEPWLAVPRSDLLPVALSPVFKTPEEAEAGSPLSSTWSTTPAFSTTAMASWKTSSRVCGSGWSSWAHGGCGVQTAGTGS